MSKNILRNKIYAKLVTYRAYYADGGFLHRIVMKNLITHVLPSSVGGRTVWVGTI